MGDNVFHWVTEGQILLSDTEVGNIEFKNFKFRRYNAGTAMTA